ncbi:MAG: hypothetical protein R6V15_01555, partial [Desulfotignum sp.]
ILEDLDLTTARRPKQTPKRVNVDFPEWMLASLDKEARRLGVNGKICGYPVCEKSRCQVKWSQLAASINE